MPLDKSCSMDAFKHNIRKSYKDGKRAQGTQHVAIALSVLKRSCGVSDDVKDMSAKEIVSTSAMREASFVSLRRLFEREPGTRKNVERSSFASMLEKFGIDVSDRSSALAVRQAGKSKASTPPISGRFKVHVDGPEIKSGDGRAPKKRGG